MTHDYCLEIIPDRKAKIGNLYGQIDYENRIIGVKKSLHNEEFVDTIIHESIHGIDDVLDLGLTEYQVTKLANGMTDLISENPTLFKMLTKLLVTKKK